MADFLVPTQDLAGKHEPTDFVTQRVLIVSPLSLVLRGAPSRFGPFEIPASIPETSRPKFAYPMTKAESSAGV